MGGQSIQMKRVYMLIKPCGRVGDFYKVILFRLPNSTTGVIASLLFFVPFCLRSSAIWWRQSPACRPRGSSASRAPPPCGSAPVRACAPSTPAQQADGFHTFIYTCTVLFFTLPELEIV